MKLSFAMPLLIVLISTNLVIFDLDFYKKEMPKFDFYENTLDNIIDYFQGSKLQTENYSKKEILHLKDVRNLIWISISLILLISIFTFIALKSNTKEQNKKELKKAGIYSLILTIILSLTLLSFSTAFTKFHELLFFNDLWLLPANSTLIQMFPETFFLESTKQIILNSFILSLSCIVLGIKIPGEKHGKRTQNHCL